jgi:hypothetical protein
LFHHKKALEFYAPLKMLFAIKKQKKTFPFALFYATKHLENRAIEKQKRKEFFVLLLSDYKVSMLWKLIAVLFVRVSNKSRHVAQSLGC